MDRRALLVTGTAALAACSLPGTAGTAQVSRAAPAGTGPDWEWVRAQFDLAPDYVHMSSFLLSSYPRSVRDEIERHRRVIDRNPVLALHGQSGTPATIAAAAEYLGGRPEEVALTDSTTMGLALIYHGLPLRAGQEVLTTTHDHYSIWGREGRWADMQPTIPAFQEELSAAWKQGKPPVGPTHAAWVTPGGFKAFEHLWALPAAFAFHHQLGRARVAERIHQLNTQCKDGLAAMKHIRLHTPRNSRLSAGLACFEVDSMTPDAAVARLLQRRIIASASPYATSYVRLAPSLVTSPADVDTALAAVRSLSSS
jgi:selenocysteine lyase/cysteine desulfurase